MPWWQVYVKRQTAETDGMLWMDAITAQLWCPVKMDQEHSLCQLVYYHNSIVVCFSFCCLVVFCGLL